MCIHSEDLLPISTKEVTHPELFPAQCDAPQLAVQGVLNLTIQLVWQWHKQLRVIQHDVEVEPVVGPHVLHVHKTAVSLL